MKRAVAVPLAAAREFPARPADVVERGGAADMLPPGTNAAAPVRALRSRSGTF